MNIKIKKKKKHIYLIAEFKLGHNTSQTAININREWMEGPTRDWTVRQWL